MPGGVSTEPILLVSACPAIGCADERVRFAAAPDPDGLFSRDNSLATRKQDTTPG